MSTSILRPCRPQFYVHVDLNFTSMSTSILRPCRPQFYFHVDLNFTSISTLILRPCRPQFYVHVDLNFTSMSTSILRPCRPQFYVHVDLNYGPSIITGAFICTVHGNYGTHVYSTFQSTHDADNRNCFSIRQQDNNANSLEDNLGQILFFWLSQFTI